MNIGFAAAALISLLTFCVHSFVGSPYAVPLLLAAKTLPLATRWLNFMTWHMVTILLAIMTLAFGAAAVGALSRDAAALLATIAASLSILSVGVTIRAGIRPWRFPASYLLASVALAGFAGLLLG